MKILKPTFIVCLVFAFGCNQTINVQTKPEIEKTATTTKVETTPTPTNEGQNNPLVGEKAEAVQKVISVFATHNPEKIAEIIGYPLERQSPIPAIKNKEEFVKRFTEVFDEKIIGQIANSKLEQWSDMDSRGIMFDNGIIWLENSDATITAVNYETILSKSVKANLIDKQKTNLHPSLINFAEPVYSINTKKFHIRIDKISEDNFRYAAWKIGQPESSKPELILNNGKFDRLGTVGNTVHYFENDGYKYSVFRNISTEDKSDFTLEIEKSGNIILTEAGSFAK